MGSIHLTGIGMRNTGTWIHGVFMTLCLVFRSISSTAPPEQTAYEELAAIETMAENVRQLENETLIQNEALSRIENLSEDLLTRILRLEAANNGTQGTIESQQKGMRSQHKLLHQSLHKLKLVVVT